MKKKFMILCLIGGLLTTGCTAIKKEETPIPVDKNDGVEKKEETKTNTLTCTYDAIMYSIVSRDGDETYKKMGKTIVTFDFDDDIIKSISTKEEFDEKYSNDEILESAEEACEEMECKASMKNGKLVLDYGTMSASEFEDSEYRNLTKKEVKELMEEDAEEADISVSCK